MTSRNKQRTGEALIASEQGARALSRGRKGTFLSRVRASIPRISCIPRAIIRPSDGSGAGEAGPGGPGAG